jgi:hypothetical protein
MTRKLLCVVTLVFGLTIAAAADTVIFSDFGPGNSYDTSTGWTLGGPNSPVCCQEIAMQFTPGTTINLKQIDLAAGWVLGTNSLTLQLAVDNNGASGTILETWTLGPMGSFGQNNPPLTAISVLNPLLQAGTVYDIVAIPADDEWAAWNLNDQGVNGQFLFSTDVGQTWNTTFGTLGAFDVIGGTTGGVPEPASLFLLGSGVAMLASKLKRTKK